MAKEQCPYLMFGGTEDHGFVVSQPVFTPLPKNEGHGMTSYDFLTERKCLVDPQRKTTVGCELASHVKCSAYIKRGKELADKGSHQKQLVKTEKKP